MDWGRGSADTPAALNSATHIDAARPILTLQRIGFHPDRLHLPRLRQKKFLSLANRIRFTWSYC
jgi:hypothetical protein